MLGFGAWCLEFGAWSLGLGTWCLVLGYFAYRLVMKIKLLFFLFFFSFRGFSQPDSCGLQFSLLTCTPGEELYSSFGHSAIRLVNTENGSDIVFNYGTFDFDDPNFYSKFVRGKLLYFVSIDAFPDFMYEYQYYQRGVTEQVLNLTCAQKQQLLYALYENAREENKYYKYDFTHDNCTTRLRDILWKMLGKAPRVPPLTPRQTSFRDLIHKYLEQNKMYWSELGIDILLGSPLDKWMTVEEDMFLPDYLMKAFDSARVDSSYLTLDKRTLLEGAPVSSAQAGIRPVIWTSLLLVLGILIGYIRKPFARRILTTLDVFIFGVSGLIGILLLFMWLGTDHQMCRDNYNLLWALPSHFGMVFFIRKNKPWVRGYFLFTAVLSLVTVIGWSFLPQDLNLALLPVTILLGWRSFSIFKK